MDSQKTIVRTNIAAWQEVEGNIVVVTPNTKKIHILSGLGIRVWELLEKPILKSQILDIIVDEYDVSREQAETDMNGFIHELLEKKIIKNE